MIWLWLQPAKRVAGAQSIPKSVLVIGDAVRTDLAGAHLMGFDSLFIAGGIHRDETVRDGVLDPAGVEKVLEGQKARPIAAMLALA